MRLYSPATTDFTTNGIGQLSSAISCFVEEKRNGSYELEMQYPVDGVHFSDIQHSCLIMAKPADGKAEQPFRIYKITKPLNKRVTVKARHISYQTSHIPVAPFTAASCAQALNGLKSNAAEACPFEFWTDKSTTANFSVEEPSSIRSRLGGTRGSILDTYGGEYEWDGYTIKLHENRGSDKGVTLRYGKNITDITQEENIENTITGVYPYWKGSEEGSTETLVELDEKVLHSANAQNFPYQMTVPLDMSSYFQNPPTQAQLRERAQAYMKANKIGIPSVSIKVSFLPLWQTEEYKELMNLERVNLCDTVTVIFERLGVEATAKVVRTKFNVLTDRYDEIELGDAKSSFGETLQGRIDEAVEISTEQVKDAKSELRKAIEHATDMITGGLGGYVVFGRNADGTPEEIYVMDKPDVTTAVNIIRINKNGIGFSTNGFSGPYANAWTIDGKLVADFITTGTLTAVLIKAGILSDVAGKNFWNMETGEFQLASTATVGGKTVAKIAKDAVDDYDTDLTQLKIFNRLTNNGQTQGIYLNNGKLYINASYIATGTLADTDKNTVFNLSTGELTMKKGSINIGNGAFQVSTAGKLTATGADIAGTVKSSGNTAWCKLVDGYLEGAHNSYSATSPNGWVGFNVYDSINRQYGAAIAGRGEVAILAPKIVVGGWTSIGGTFTGYDGYTGNLSYANGIGNVDVTVKPTYTEWTNVQRSTGDYYYSIRAMTDVSVTVSVTPSYGTLAFKNGICY